LSDPAGSVIRVLIAAPGDFTDVASGGILAPAASYFIAGNHEPLAALDADGGPIEGAGRWAPDVTYFGRAGVANTAGLRVGFLSGIYGKRPYGLSARLRADPFRRAQVEECGQPNIRVKGCPVFTGDSLAVQLERNVVQTPGPCGRPSHVARWTAAIASSEPIDLPAHSNHIDATKKLAAEHKVHRNTIWRRAATRRTVLGMR